MDTTELEQKLGDMPLDMKKFTDCLLALDQQLKVSTNLGEQAVMDFNSIYVETKRDAFVYCEKILPLTKQTVANLSNYFDTYEVLEFSEWKEFLDDIVDDVTNYRRMCDILVKQYQDIMGPLKARKAKAVQAVENMDDLADEYKQQVKHFERMAREAQDEADKSRRIANWFAVFTYGISSLIGEAVASGHDEEAETALVEAQAKKRNAAIITAAMQACQDNLIPALENFLDGLKACSGFFQTTEFLLQKMQDTGEEARYNRKKIYWLKMKKNATRINASCRLFAFMLPDIITDLKAIRQSPSDKNYVDEWEAKQKKKIKEKYGKSFMDRFYRKLQHVGDGLANTLATAAE